MLWKNFKGNLFRFIGPNVYRGIHAGYFFIRLIYALCSSRFGEKFFGRDLIAFADRLKPGDQVLDIGAFLGASTVLFGKAVGRKGLVIAFEPIHARLLKVILKPFCLKQISVKNIALAAKNGNTELVIPLYNGIPLYSQSGFMESYIGDHIGKEYTFQKFTTSLIRLDDFLLQRGIAPESLTAIKIDVEGAEMAVFEGAEDFFRRFKGMLLCEFWYNQNPPLGWIWLQERGYSCSHLRKDNVWVLVNTPEALAAISRGETYGNFFWEKLNK